MTMSTSTGDPPVKRCKNCNAPIKRTPMHGAVVLGSTRWVHYAPTDKYYNSEVRWSHCQWGLETIATPQEEEDLPLERYVC